MESLNKFHIINYKNVHKNLNNNVFYLFQTIEAPATCQTLKCKYKIYFFNHLLLYFNYYQSIKAPIKQCIKNK